jgi:hypothetical protein
MFEALVVRALAILFAMLAAANGPDEEPIVFDPPHPSVWDVLMVATPTPAEPAEPIVVAASTSTWVGGCYDHPDRYNWQPYARAAGFPEWAMEELAYVIHVESRGDLCAVNSSSGATCWIQQYPGGTAFLDPVVCMAQGYAKWLDGGQAFERHWYRWWR